MAELKEFIGAKIVKISDSVWSGDAPISWLVVELSNGDRIKLVPKMFYEGLHIEQEEDD